MRILHVQRVKGIGGSERHLLTLLPGLVARGVDVRMCVLEMDGGERFVDELRGSGIDTAVHRAGPDVNPALSAALYREIRRFRPDVVHTHLVHADVHGLLAARVARVPGVSSVHGTPAFYKREPYRSAGRVAGKLAARRIAISEHVAAFLREQRLVLPERIRVVYYGIDADSLHVTPADRSAQREALGLRDGDVALGIASRLIPGKGHEALLDAFGRAVEAFPSLRLLVAGDGPERGRLEAQAKLRSPPGAVRFVGFVDRVAAFLAACDTLAIPTQPELGEGFGLAALEAMAVGRPVIATAVGSLPEVVDDGRTGLVVPAGSVELLARAVLTLARDPALRERLGTAGARRARNVFPLDRMVTRTIDVYNEVV
jgi:glycosyltransferase involved in cell wall biosynthesis